jgi:hypothetical protein
MGGIGSGTWCRWSKQETTESCKRIDIRYMRRNGLLVPGSSNSLSWSCNGEPSGSIRYRYSGGCLLLDFKFRVNGGEWEPVEQIVPLTSTACNYGNSRQWFLCPRCNYRCAVLYGVNKLFLCRKCYRLPYSSQMNGYLDRLLDKKHDLGERIFEHYEFGEGWLKKKGMHQKTFDRLYSKYKNLELRIDQGTIAQFGLKLSDF